MTGWPDLQADLEVDHSNGVVHRSQAGGQHAAYGAAAEERRLRVKPEPGRRPKPLVDRARRVFALVTEHEDLRLCAVVPSAATRLMGVLQLERMRHAGAEGASSKRMR